MTCKDCIHKRLCVIKAFPDMFENTKWDKKHCDQFKNKANFVEVVRCRDCKYRILWDDGMGGQKNFCELFYRGVADDEYCSFGKRKGGAE